MSSTISMAGTPRASRVRADPPAGYSCRHILKPAPARL